MPSCATPVQLAEWVAESRERTIELVADLTDEQLIGPRLSTVNPLLWEIGHTAWFQEKWVLRHACGAPPVRDDADALYDSIAIPHDTRWDLPLPTRAATLAYMREVRDRVIEKLLLPNPTDALLYFARYCVHHDDMHNEAFTYTRQTLGYSAPTLNVPRRSEQRAGSLPGDAFIPGGEFLLGSPRSAQFVFDNEKWEHRVTLERFEMARAAVTQAEFAAFMDDGGYSRRELWIDAGWQWRERAGASRPLYWKRDGETWLRRRFDRWVPLEPDRAMVHVNWFEADAYCRWARRRLPTEAEWEFAASANCSITATVPPSNGGDVIRKSDYPWGDAPPTTARANLDWQSDGCVDVAAHPDGDTALGCRQMLGNVWEWTISDFLPYPGFTPDAYKEYSQPWFGTHKVLRGGCWATRSRMIRNAYRNFYTPDRRDVWAGFRTCKSV